MKREDVPQDAAIFGQWHGICYALDDEGRYVLTPSAGWDPANVANLQAWEVIAEEIREAIEAVRSGTASPLAFHMARCQMDVGLLASYAHLPRWRVRRHLRPAVYARLKPELRARYARVFGVAPEHLDQIPDMPQLPVALDEYREDQAQ
ncbi:hypothetical protein DESUT3_02730 [Desulfuromonas versatilis]|uniref:Uncharacterized protein n=1 Tax=Desulfuromonas versatilis TaxID=2802975 RepID=A0ABN6DUL9_9BACT|nr:hypothetical protein [Desulfuromonas versatilis]BCR03204.1 hypothetical protein DESUT3_02730 [Desulfuromonas versatilis]